MAIQVCSSNGYEENNNDQNQKHKINNCETTTSNYVPLDEEYNLILNKLKGLNKSTLSENFQPLLTLLKEKNNSLDIDSKINIIKEINSIDRLQTNKNSLHDFYPFFISIAQKFKFKKRQEFFEWRLFSCRTNNDIKGLILSFIDHPLILNDFYESMKKILPHEDENQIVNLLLLESINLAMYPKAGFQIIEEIKNQLTFTENNKKTDKQRGQDNNIARKSKLTKFFYFSDSLSNKELAAICEAFPCLTFLDLRNCRYITKEGFDAIAQNCRDITILDVTRTNITNDALSNITKNCPHIKSLSFYDCENITEDGITSAFLNCKNLLHFDLAGLNISSDKFRTIAPYFSQIENLVIWGDSVSEEGLKIIAPYCVNLTVLELIECQIINDEIFEKIIKNSNKLKVITLNSCNYISSKGLNAISNYAEELIKLELFGVNLESKTLKNIFKNCKNLVSVAVAFVKNLNEKIDVFNECSEKLKYIDLRSLNMNDSILSSFAPAYENLLYLDISENKITSDGIINITPYLNNLTHLGLREIKNIREDAFQSIGKFCKNLRYIDLKYASGMNEGIKYIIEGCPELIILKLKGSDLTDEGLKNIVIHHSKLEQLYLNDTEVSDESLKKIPNIYMNIEYLNLSHTKITDKLFELISKKLTKLHEISLSHTKITNNGVSLLLKYCDNLNFIDLYECEGVTPEYITKFRNKYSELQYIQGFVSLYAGPECMLTF